MTDDLCARLTKAADNEDGDLRALLREAAARIAELEAQVKFEYMNGYECCKGELMPMVIAAEDHCKELERDAARLDKLIDLTRYDRDVGSAGNGHRCTYIGA